MIGCRQNSLSDSWKFTEGVMSAPSMEDIGVAAREAMAEPDSIIKARLHIMIDFRETSACLARRSGAGKCFMDE